MQCMNIPEKLETEEFCEGNMEPGTEEANGVHPDPTWSFLQSFARPSKRPPRRMMQVVESCDENMKLAGEPEQPHH